MNFFKEWSGTVALAIIAISTLVGMFGVHSNALGSTSCGSITCLSGGLRLVADAGGDFEVDIASVFSGLITTGSGGIKIGASGTTMTQMNNGTCPLTAATYTILASSTKLFSCSATGVAAGDRTFVQLLASSTPAGMGFVVIGSLATTSTSNSIEVRVANMTGADAIIPANIASSTAWQSIR